MRSALNYFAALKPGKIVLWCYLIGYLVNVGFRFDPSRTLWLNAAGISGVIGTGLLLSVGRVSSARRLTKRSQRAA